MLRKADFNILVILCFKVAKTTRMYSEYATEPELSHVLTCLINFSNNEGV